MHKVISPIYIMLPRVRVEDKKVSLNLNVYRNLHYQVNNNMKAAYSAEMFSQLYQLRFRNRIDLEFVLYKPNKRKFDRANILCIVEKYFCDALTHAHCIEDDDDEFIRSTHYRTGGIDKDNPRVEIFISEANGASKSKGE